MLRPNKEKPSESSFHKFVKVFSMLMTLVYVALGIFIMFAENETLNISIPKTYKLVLGGILILYGAVRFVRAYKTNSNQKNDEHE
ncbi:hypothetical protein ACFSKU_06105 [Pontibacter silvestris]|uniref:Uncharacterized protein n=1 Tax=Pontibacter silvestris TaxID=2305183 RepID=A0ABW4WUL1_9BACT|nr:hypothetical protein [Pontibacter silvestris]MCC9136407.1 hypothetical protein [Pontibacter silvestris]